MTAATTTQFIVTKSVTFSMLGGFALWGALIALFLA